MSDEQLQLFQALERPVRVPQRGGPSLGYAVLRHDHAVLLAMIAMIAASALFAFGVERGKRLASSRLIAQTVSMPEAMREREPSPLVETAKPAKTPRVPSKVASAASRFAIQVVSYSEMKFAQRELQQLQRQGEHAFLVQRQGKTALLVGPFPTKENAGSKLLILRQRYRDCFVRTL